MRSSVVVLHSEIGLTLVLHMEGSGTPRHPCWRRRRRFRVEPPVAFFLHNGRRIPLRIHRRADTALSRHLDTVIAKVFPG